jgi:hypothetical protein
VCGLIQLVIRSDAVSCGGLMRFLAADQVGVTRKNKRYTHINVSKITQSSAIKAPCNRYELGRSERFGTSLDRRVKN